MKRFIQVISDIHLELRQAVRPETIIKPRCSDGVLILAGDIGKPHPDTLSPFLDYCCSKWAHVLYVAGNHEFYGKKHTRESTLAELRNYQTTRPNLKFLDRDIVTIDGQRFLGCTLWCDAKPFMQYAINDFNWIKQGTTFNIKLIDTSDMAKWHMTDLEWLKANVQKDDIVITHFMPLSTTDLIELGHKSLYPPSELDMYYGNTDCYDLIKVPKLWISGHTHQSFDVQTDGARWVCNPYGYPSERSTYNVDLDPTVEK